tara:strand:- start:6012 stop:6203 length:192 start_codon:yes stop_codon:yes gene_type:complete
MTKPRKSIDDMIDEMKFVKVNPDRHMGSKSLIEFYENLMYKNRIKKDGAAARRLNEIKLRKFK